MTRFKKITTDTFFTRYGRKLLPLMAVLLLSHPEITAARPPEVDFGSTRVTLKEAFRQIQAQTGLGLAYSSRVLDVNRTVTLPARRLNVDAAMDAILLGSGFTYSEVSGVITIKKRALPAAEPVPAVTIPEWPGPDESLAPEIITEAVPAIPDRRRDGPVIVVLNTLPESITPPQIDFAYGYYPVENYMLNLSYLPRWAIKTNLLYAGAALTPNIALEYGITPRVTVNLSGSYNPWNRVGDKESNKKLVHSVFKGEARYWTCDRFNGHFVGGHLLYTRYNIGSHKIPTLFKKDYRYDGHGVGAGVTYGYHLMVAKRWGVEFSVGAGVVRMDYRQYDCAVCNREYVKTGKTWFGPTDAGISLVFMIK